jgi:3-dehydroquinate synthase
MIEIKVNTVKGYRVLISKGLLSEAGNFVKLISPARKTMVISDEKVAKLYGSKLLSSLDKAGLDACIYPIKVGEKSKNIGTYVQIVRDMAAREYTRKDALIALGGGVVGDITGFVASTYMRGIDFIQIPTTLLSGIDAAIGGKNGIDLPEGKNYVGTFYQPRLVLCDTETYRNLPNEEKMNGIGEGIKYAVLAGGEILEILEKGLDESNEERFLELCIKYKASVVENDERERGNRMLLNLGHTMGHAIEKISKYTIPHGLAVVKGLYMLITAPGAVALAKHERERIINLIKKYDFDVTVPFKCGDLINAVRNDKKAEPGNMINIVTVKGIGNCELVKLSQEELCRFFGHDPSRKIN